MPKYMLGTSSLEASSAERDLCCSCEHEAALLLRKEGPVCVSSYVFCQARFFLEVSTGITDIISYTEYIYL